LALNFIAIPTLAVAAATGFGLKRDAAVAMVLLAASPFAPVVPVFARMGRAHLALAAALTGVFPLACVILTPFTVRAALLVFGNGDVVHFNIWNSLATLLTTITLPLAVGVLIRHRAPEFGRRLLRPMELISEAVGAASLAFVTITQFNSILNLGWPVWLAMALVSELSFVLGWQLGGPCRARRQVVALGTSNRNIALALLLAIQSFHGTNVISAVVGEGLLLIALGLVHVAWWRFFGTVRRVD
jgi:BASS family bile acid:Na+ symporter